MIGELFSAVGRLVSEEDGTFALDCNDAGVLFVEASSPISAVEVRDDRLLHAYENFSPLDRYAFPDIASLQDAPLLAVQVEFRSSLKIP
jgi:hypothetical protein